MFLLSQETKFFFENRQQPNARAGPKKHMFLVMHCPNLMRALSWNREKKHSGLTVEKQRFLINGSQNAQI